MLTAMYAKELRDTPIRVNPAIPVRLIGVRRDLARRRHSAAVHPV